ncbi:multidrug and toxin extrusion protein 1-like [Liolophura sinensis]|uniref:multidrug and toxin extrusion protein 1-like n=1 Tax=Liolophura sinensis TaxID=3198878 RepID=UPI00315882B2
MLAITVGYIVCTGLYKETWTGWSWEALEQWGQFLYLAVAGLIMIAIEWWSFEIGLFLNGIIGEVELGATSVVFQLEQIIYMVPYGMGVASSIRVGHSLGAGNAKAAKTTAMTSQLLAWLCLLVTATVILSMKNLLPLLFTQDPEVIPMASSILPILVIILFLDSIVATSMGTLRGCGRQWTAAICNAVGYLGISIPIAVVFMFIVGIGAFGFWWAMCLGISPTACLYIYFLTRRINWDNEVHKARERTTTRRKVKVIEETAPLISDETNVDETADGKTGQPNGTRLSEALDYERTMSTDESVFRKRLIVLVVKRVFGCLSVLALFVASICIRLFVPLPAEPSIIPAMNVTMATATSPDYDI